MSLDIEWSAGSDGIQQTVRLPHDRRLDIKIDNEGVALNLYEHGTFVGGESATYEEIAEGLEDIGSPV